MFTNYLMMESSANKSLEFMNSLALEEGERYTYYIDPRYALEAIASLFRYYSLHVDSTGNAIMISVKNKPKKTLHISKRAMILIERHLR